MDAREECFVPRKCSLEKMQEEKKGGGLWAGAMRQVVLDKFNNVEDVDQDMIDEQCQDLQVPPKQDKKPKTGKALPLSEFLHAGHFAQQGW